jgi:hypothetical protein
MIAVVDRISEGIAVLLLGNEEYQVNLPVEFLPEGTREGQWLDVEFKLNEQLTDERFRKNRELLEKIRRKNHGK